GRLCRSTFKMHLECMFTERRKIVGVPVRCHCATVLKQVGEAGALHEYRPPCCKGPIEHMLWPLPLVLMELQRTIVVVVPMTEGEHGNRQCKGEEAVSDHAQKIIHFTKDR